MLAKLLTVFRIPELRQKIFLTLVLLAVYRMGFAIPLPFLDQEQFGETIRQLKQGGSGVGQVIQVVALFSASSIGNATIFGLGIMPYISASIIFQLLGVGLSAAGAVAEGRRGRPQEDQRIHPLRHGLICLGQSYFWIRMLSGGLGSGMPV